MVIFLFILNLFLISFDKALQIDSNCLDAWNNKGVVLNNLGQYEKAIEWQFFYFKYFFH